MINVGWGLVAVGLFVYWRRRGRRFPLGAMVLGLAGSALLAAAMAAAQLFPVVEFAAYSGRSETEPREIYQYALEPGRLIELAWPNILGMPLESKSYWGDRLRTPGGRPRGWVPSLYLGGLTLALAMSAVGLRSGPAWRVWLTAIAVLSALASLGQYTSPIWLARAVAVTSGSPAVRAWTDGLGPFDARDPSPIRTDGCLRDSDGCVYWTLATVLPGFGQFRYPAKLFTLTALAVAALAGLGWDRLLAEHRRKTVVVFAALAMVSVAVLGAVVVEKAPIMASFQTLKSSSSFGPFEPASGYRAVVESLGQAVLIFGAGLVLAVTARRRPYLAGAAALIVTTVDLAAANRGTS